VIDFTTQIPTECNCWYTMV